MCGHKVETPLNVKRLLGKRLVDNNSTKEKEWPTVAKLLLAGKYSSKKRVFSYYSAFVNSNLIVPGKKDRVHW